MTLVKYKDKRNFRNTPEPAPKKVRKKPARSFVVQRHDASHLHYDFRLEVSGVLKSWAVPKGPSMNPSDKRLAVMVEDHPLPYGKFEGEIPEGNYGAGSVEIWDHGTFEPLEGEADDKAIEKKLKKGSVKFSLHGKKLNGSFALVQMKGGKGNNWLLIKHKDQHARGDHYDIEGVTRESPPAETKEKGNQRFATAEETTTPDATAKMKSNKRNENKVKKSPPVKAPKRQEEKVKVDGHELTLSNQNKIYWPDEKITKGDVIRYYDAVSKYILPYLKNRPQSLKRNPNGITDKGFFHKDAGHEAPEWVDTVSIPSESSHKNVEYIVCNNKATLSYLNNLGCIELNPWNSRLASLDYPDYLAIDLDPSDNNSFDQVIETAGVVKQVLDKAGAASYCKTSGATGLHIYVPLKARYTYEQVGPFAEKVAMMTCALLPETTTVERALVKRKGRIYVDYLQNKKGQTLASVYSVRPKPGATVSTPLLWKEVKPGLHPSAFDIRNIGKRLGKTGDLFAGVLKDTINLQKCFKNLGS